MNSSSRLLLVLSIATLALIVLGVFVFHSTPPPPSSPLQTTQGVVTSSALESTVSTSTPSVSVRVVPTGMREYQSATYHFSLFYPPELAVTEQSEGGGALTVTFQNVQKAEGFQIFIVPYSEKQITDERFRQDEPSGVRNGLQNIVIDGATGASFYSTNATLGDTAEVWFVKEGYLYEVTTLKPLASWLTPILNSWKFL